MYRLIAGSFLVLGILAFTGYFYSYIFSKTVEGKIVSVERVAPTVAYVDGHGSQSAMSFGVAIKTDSGDIMTASSEDRQWAAAKEGYCVEAKYYPYPPWYLQKGGTYHDARLLRMYECK